METIKEKKIVVGFWLRCLSDILDAIFLGIFGFLISIPLRGIFYSMGEHGLWLGLIITFLYTGILQSSIGQGQSLAKKLLKIQVLSIDGTYLSLTRSFIRYSILALIFYNDWIGMALINSFSFLSDPVVRTIYGFVIVILLVGTVVLVAMHPLKRGLQDLIVNSVVVRQGMYDRQKLDELNDPSKTKRAYIVWGITVALIAGVFIYVTLFQKSFSSTINSLTSLSQQISKNTDLTVKRVGITYRNEDGGKRSMDLNVTVFLNKEKYDDEDERLDEVEKTVGIIIKDYPKVSECNDINVHVLTGFNIGITSLYYSSNYPYTTDGKPIKE